MRISIEQDPVILIEYPTGIRYTAQVGGVACRHPEVEGFILPTGWIDAFMERGWHHVIPRITCEYGCAGNTISDEGLETLQRWWGDLFDTSHFRLTVQLDPWRWEQSTEAWLPISLLCDIRPNDPDYLRAELEFLHDKRGFLVTRNCD